MERLSERELNEALARLPAWSLQADRLVREWRFQNFVEAMAFVNRVAELAEAAGHHPDIEIRYNLVRLALVTHDAGGITGKDASMAGRLDRELQSSGK